VFRIIALFVFLISCAPAFAQTVWVQRSGPSSLSRWTYATTQNGKLVLDSNGGDRFSMILIKPQSQSYKLKTCEKVCKIEAVIGNHSETLLADPYDETDQFIIVDLNRNQQQAIKELEASNGTLMVKMPYQSSMSNIIRVTMGNARIGEQAKQKSSAELPR
jgi:hypothetical protein